MLKIVIVHLGISDNIKMTADAIIEGAVSGNVEALAMNIYEAK